MDSAQLHEWVDRYNWDDGLAPIWVIADSPKTEFATALMIYWLLGGPGLEADPGSIIDEAKSLQDMVRERLLAGFYAQGSSRFDPSAKLSLVSIYQLRKAGVPDLLLGSGDGYLARVDSLYIHAEVVNPALALLNGVGFTGAADEFLKARRLYRSGDFEAAIVEALKAFESTMKSICDARGWTLNGMETARQLIEIIFNNDLLPRDMLSHFNALRTTLEAGLPTVRNLTSGHGQGTTPVQVPDYVVAYALHLAATNIVFLVEAHRSQP